jgi:uncharacterized protein
MKKVLSLVLLITMHLGIAQEKYDVAAVEKFQSELNSICMNPKCTPLSKKQMASFKSLNFFPINEKFCVEAKIVRTEAGEPIKIDDKLAFRSRYLKYGEAHFFIDGKPFQLNLYYNIEYIKTDEGKNSLFLPFTDFTSGRESYIGGRFIELKKREGDTIIIDFNKSYNPCCAFRKYINTKIPKENDLKIEIKAGVKKYRDE